MANRTQFEEWKEQCLRKADLSRKGAVDVGLVSVLQELNGNSNFFCTSSCSGRILLIEAAGLVVFLSSTDSSPAKHTQLCLPNIPSGRTRSASKPLLESAAGVQKQGCTWLFVSHSLVLAKDLEKALESVSRDVTLKFEAFVLHVQCWRLDDARLLHTVAVQSGFRNSGIAMGKKGKVIVAIRSTHGLEVPLCRSGVLLVSNEYLEFLAHTANEKMKDNWSKIERFLRNVQVALHSGNPVAIKKQEIEVDHHDYVRRSRRKHEVYGKSS
uniref:tRNA wybutosine-synthesizing protein 3 homolog isoform X1 n=1 Tax=Myxine glutinosa TaxID=7769 RepID=UPI00358F29FD